jgi:hypothetical protein
VLRDDRHDAHGHPVRVRHVGGHEIDARLLQAEQEVRVAGQPVELGDDERRAVQRQVRIAFANSGRSLRLPLSTSVNSSTSDHAPPFRKSVTAFRCASSPKPERPCRSVLTR